MRVMGSVAVGNKMQAGDVDNEKVAHAAYLKSITMV